MNTINKSRESKYDSFFEDMKSFFINLGWSVVNDFIPAKEEQIYSLEREKKLAIGRGYKTYLKHFGNKINIPYLDKMFYKFDLETINQIKTIEAEWHSEFSDNEKFISWKDKIIILHKEQDLNFNNSILPFFYDEQSNYVIYTISKEKDFVLHMASSIDFLKGNLEGKSLFVNKFRENLFTCIKHILKHKNKYPLNIVDNLFKLPWINFYQDWLDRNGNFASLKRSSYLLQMYKIEDTNNNFFGINEFEIELMNMQKP